MLHFSFDVINGHYDFDTSNKLMLNVRTETQVIT